MKLLRIVLLTTFVFFLSFQISFAESSYVLPYPSSMPGSIFYKVNLVLDELEKYWHFGNLGQFSYSLKLSDKYLIEAKTLFEYKQYLLGVNALKKSDFHFKAASHFLQKANSDDVDITEKKSLFSNAGLKHEEVLSVLKNKVPKEFLWQPENSSSSNLQLWNDIDNSLNITKSCT